ncbi:unnamed protein product [Amaranthus hypochondriacus]
MFAGKKLLVSMARYRKGGTPFSSKTKSGSEINLRYKNTFPLAYRGQRRYSDVLLGKQRWDISISEDKTSPISSSLKVAENMDISNSNELSKGKGTTSSPVPKSNVLPNLLTSQESVNNECLKEGTTADASNNLEGGLEVRGCLGVLGESMAAQNFVFGGLSCDGESSGVFGVSSSGSKAFFFWCCFVCGMFLDSKIGFPLVGCLICCLWRFFLMGLWDRVFCGDICWFIGLVAWYSSGVGFLDGLLLLVRSVKLRVSGASISGVGVGCFGGVVGSLCLRLVFFPPLVWIERGVGVFVRRVMVCWGGLIVLTVICQKTWGGIAGFCLASKSQVLLVISFGVATNRRLVFSKVLLVILWCMVLELLWLSSWVIYCLVLASFGGDEGSSLLVSYGKEAWCFLWRAFGRSVGVSSPLVDLMFGVFIVVVAILVGGSGQLFRGALGVLRVV